MNILRNAEFFIELAEKGKSLQPHTPKRLSDRIGLFREICRLIGQRDVFFTRGTLSDKSIAVKSQTSTILARRRIYIASENGGFIFASTHLYKRSVSAIARYRILMYFAPILSLVDYGYLKLLESDR